MGIFRTPLHCEPDELIGRCRRLPFEEFLGGEARYDCGNYCLVDSRHDRIRVITAPGYTGGYITLGGESAVVATTFVDAMTAAPHEPSRSTTVPFGTFTSTNCSLRSHCQGFSTTSDGYHRPATSKLEMGKSTGWRNIWDPIDRGRTVSVTRPRPPRSRSRIGTSQSCIQVESIARPCTVPWRRHSHPSPSTRL